MRKNKQLGALPVGFTASIWGIKFKAVNQLDMFGGAVIILQSDNEDITTLTGNNTSKAVDEMLKWLKQQPKIQEQTVKEWKVTAKNFRGTSQNTFKVYAKDYYDADRQASWKINNEQFYKNYKIVSVKETGKELTDVLKKNIEELIVNLNGELREFNKGKNTAKRVKKTVVIEAPKTVVKTEKATTKNKTVKSSTMRQTGTSNKLYDQRKQAMKPGKRPSPSGKRPFYYEYRANRSDAGELLGFKYFNVNFLKSIDDLKKAYFSLSKKLHPDVGGDTAEFQQMVNEYEMLTDMYLINGNFTDAQIKAQIELDAAYQSMVDALAPYPGITIELIGSWIWVGGATYPIRSILSSLGFVFAPKKKMWYLNTTGIKTKRTRTMDIELIRKKYGTKNIKPKGGKSLDGILKPSEKVSLKRKMKKLIDKMKKAYK